MDKQQLAHFEKIINERREHLRKDILEHLDAVDDNSVAELYGRVHDSGEESIADMLVDMNFKSLEQESRDVAAMESALVRIRSGSYGQCIDCGEEIEVERLEANPAAERCYSCQEKSENDQSGRDRTPSL